MIDTSLINSYFAAANINREVFVVNDTTASVDGTLHISIESDGNVLCSTQYDVALSQGEMTSVKFNAKLPEDVQACNCTYKASFIRSDGEILDSWSRAWKIGSIPSLTIENRVAIFGSGKLAGVLDDLGIQHSYVDLLDAETLFHFAILIMEDDTVCPGSNQNLQLLDFMRRGGRVIVMEQQHSLFPGITLVDSR